MIYMMSRASISFKTITNIFRTISLSILDLCLHFYLSVHLGCIEFG